MMLAFCDGSLCEAIRRAIMSNRFIVQNFFDLCNEVVDMPLDESVRCDVLGFVMQRYVNMPEKRTSRKSIWRRIKI
eukprot:scaffold151675_cov55-Attheya_sp.AAC.1